MTLMVIINVTYHTPKSRVSDIITHVILITINNVVYFDWCMVRLDLSRPGLDYGEEVQQLVKT